MSLFGKEAIASELILVADNTDRCGFITLQIPMTMLVSPVTVRINLLDK